MAVPTITPLCHRELPAPLSACFGVLIMVSAL
jgi:hypothetical protein